MDLLPLLMLSIGATVALGLVLFAFAGPSPQRAQSRRLAAMRRGQLPKCADHRHQLIEPAIVREHAQEASGQRIQLQRARGRLDRIGRIPPRNQWAGRQLLEIIRFVDRRAQPLQAGLDRVDRLCVARELEQRGRVTTR